MDDTRGKSVTLPRTGTAFNENQSNTRTRTATDDIGGTNNSSRPVSFYDNIRHNGDNSPEYSSLNRNGHELEDLRLSRERSPTQLHLLNTTVPQNIGGANIGGRHEPTRNSLRHSRMIVMGRSGNVPKKYLPPIIRFHKLAKALVGLQVLLGSALGTLSLWLLLWTPSIRTRDNPYWSGVPLLFSGILGLILLCCCRKEYPGMPKGYFVYSMKVLSIFLSTTAGAACLIACAFAIIHLISLGTMECAPLNQLNTTCFCKIERANETSLPVTSYHYVDLSCPEVDNILSILIIFSCGTNIIGGFVSLWYVYLHWVSRYSYTYSKVRSEENRPVIISNT